MPGIPPLTGTDPRRVEQLHRVLGRADSRAAGRVLARLAGPKRYTGFAISLLAGRAVRRTPRPDTHAPRDEAVLARAPTSAQICAYTGNTVFWGHWAQAVDRDEQADMMQTISSDDTWLPAVARRRRFWDFGMTWVFLDGDWRDRFLRGPAASLLADADKVFENSEVTIYRRRTGGSPRRNLSYHAAN